MARKNTVSAENLAALGAERLAALLIELGEADTAVRKRLVLAVAERGGPAVLIKAVDRRLTALANSYGLVAWEREKAYAAEIDGLRGVIAQSLAPVDAPAAAERLGRLIRLAPAVSQRVDDSSGRFEAIFRAAVGDLGAVWARMDIRDPEAIAGEALALILEDRFGPCGDLVTDTAEGLGPEGLAALARRATAALAGLGDAKAEEGFGGPRHKLRKVLIDIADARGDIDGFIAAQTEVAGGYVDTLGIATRLIAAGRAEEALTWLDQDASRHGRASDPDGESRPHSLDWVRAEWRIKALEQLKRRPEAQALRWRMFEHTLSVDVLRAYVRALPDFEDDPALERAFALAVHHPDANAALGFFTDWPNLAAAARLTLDRLGELDGRDYHTLGPAAEALSDRHPLAATLLYRRLIDSTLERGAAKAYGFAAKNLAACAVLDSEIDWSASPWPAHATYVRTLLTAHGRKWGFWSLVKS